MQLAPYALGVTSIHNMREPTLINWYVHLGDNGTILVEPKNSYVLPLARTQSVVLIKPWVDPMVLFKAVRLPAMATSSIIHIINESYTAWMATIF